MPSPKPKTEEEKLARRLEKCKRLPGYEKTEDEARKKLLATAKRRKNPTRLRGPAKARDQLRSAQKTRDELLEELEATRRSSNSSAMSRRRASCGRRR